MKSLLGIVSVLVMSGCGNTTGPDGTPPCRCTATVSQGSVDAACGAPACVGGVGYVCSADGTSVQLDPTACPEVHHYSAGQGGMMGSYEAELAGSGRPYAVHVPKGYTGEKGVPLVLHFHGWRPAPSGIQDEIDYVYGKLSNKEGLIAVALEGGPCPELNPKGEPFLCFRDSRDGALVAKLLEELGQHYNIDLDRVYLSGHSGGSFFVQGHGLTNPTRYAAAVEFSGGCIADSPQYGNSCVVYDKLSKKATRKLPMFLVHNPWDGIVPQDYSLSLQETLAPLGHMLKTHFDEYDGGKYGHSIDNSLVPEVWDWLQTFHHPNG